jgi:hypothetical protein
MSAKSPLDLNELAQGQKVDIKVASPEDPSDARLRRFKDAVLFITSIIGALGFGGFCVYIYIAASSSADDRKWAASIITLIVGGLVGYWSGKNSK